MTAPLSITFDVACSTEHAFDVWTSRIGVWWPTDHTVTGDADAVVVLQSGVGGRIYERTADGAEHDWGEVTLWDPPTRLAYLWHLRQDRADATEVEVRFIGLDAAATRIEIEHRGWERLGRAADDVRAKNRAGWDAVLPHYLAAIAASPQSRRETTDGCWHQGGPVGPHDPTGNLGLHHVRRQPGRSAGPGLPGGLHHPQI